jgi:hypothetical protein
MTPQEALRFIQGANRVGRITYSKHRQDDSHHVSMADQEHAIAHATSIRRNDESEHWEVVGPDRDGQQVTVVVAIEGNTVHTVTAFGV